MTQIWWPPSDVDASAPWTVEYETYQNGNGPHSYSSIPGLEAHDLMILFSMGTYAVNATPFGWKQMGYNAGGVAMAIGCYVRYATSSSESATFNFATNASSQNYSSLVIVRGSGFVACRAFETFAAVNNSTALTFPQAGNLALADSGVPEALMFLTNVTVGITWTPTPTPTATIYNRASLGGSREAELHRVPGASTYGASVSASTFKAGIVLEIV